jgi:lipid-A-disaccharide synthase
MTKRIFFSVGEPSGDQHAARLIRELGVSSADIQTRGFGGQAMSQAGCRLDLDLTSHAVVGLVEVLPKLRDFFRFADRAEDVFRSGEADAVVLVDFPGFNWHVAKRAKRYDVPVFYYCPPQLWAWGGWRVGKMRRTVDHVLSVLPVEQRYLTRHQIPATYVGHPFFDAVAGHRLDPVLMRRLKQLRPVGQRVVAVLPGSRTHEVRRNWPIMMRAIRALHGRHPDVRFAVAAYGDRHCLWCHEQLTADDRGLPIDFFVGKTSEVIEAAHCAMMVSGSVSLELMARRTPAAVIYRVSRFFHAVARRVVGVDSMTLPNLMSERHVFPEMVSVGRPQAAVDFLTESIEAMLSDEFYYRQTVEQLDELSRRYAVPGASRRAADWIIDRMRVQSRPAGRRQAA